MPSRQSIQEVDGNGCLRVTGESASSMSRHRFLLLSGCLLASGNTLSQQPTLSQQLLDSYFQTAGVCTTSQVQTIRDTGKLVTIEISIEEQTRQSLLSMTDQDRANWFSLHCPPEIHGVWRQQNPPDDIRVSGQVAPDQTYTLSCLDFQQNLWNQRESTLKDRILEWLDKRRQ